MFQCLQNVYFFLRRVLCYTHTIHKYCTVPCQEIEEVISHGVKKLPVKSDLSVTLAISINVCCGAVNPSFLARVCGVVPASVTRWQHSPEGQQHRAAVNYCVF